MYFYYFICFGALGGLIRHFHKNNGKIELPKWDLNDNTKTFNLGFLNDILLGTSSALCFPLFYKNIPTNFQEMAALGFVSGFLGQVILEMVREKFISGFKIVQTHNAIKQNTKVNRKFSYILEEIKNILEIEHKKNSNKKDTNLVKLDNQLKELNIMLKNYERQCKKLK